MSIYEHIRGFNCWRKYVKNWGQLVLMKIGLKKTDFLLKFRNGLKLNLINRGEYSDTTVIREIWFENDYCKNGFCDFRNNPIVLDIGANVGIFSTYIAKKNPSAKVFAYEASSLNCKYAQKNVNLNNFNNRVFINNFAVTSKDNGNINLFIHEKGSGGNSLLKEAVFSKKGKVESVPQISIKKIVESNNIKKVDLLKMDIEGGEYDSLLNIDEKTLSKIKKITLEHHKITGFDKYDIIFFLMKNGFKISEPSSAILYAERKK